MKEDKKQQVINELSQRLFRPIQQMTQLLQPLAKSFGHVRSSLYAIYQEGLEVERTLEDLPIDDYLKIPQLLKKSLEQRQAGGRVRGGQLKQAAQVRREKVITMWNSLETTPTRDRVGIIVRNTKYSDSTVRRILREAGLK
jgi:hypothetical protein